MGSLRLQLDYAGRMPRPTVIFIVLKALIVEFMVSFEESVRIRPQEKGLPRCLLEIVVSTSQLR